MKTLIGVRGYHEKHGGKRRRVEVRVWELVLRKLFLVCCTFPSLLLLHIQHRFLDNFLYCLLTFKIFLSAKQIDEGLLAFVLGVDSAADDSSAS